MTKSTRLRIPVPAILVAAIAGLPAVAATPAAQRPNIVLMISDDQDNQHLGFMGNTYVHTPAIDRLARAGDPAQRRRLAEFKSQVMQWWRDTGGKPLRASVAEP